MDSGTQLATDILAAVQEDDTARLAELISRPGPDCPVPVRMQYAAAGIDISDVATPLIAAIVSKSGGCVNALIAAGASVEARFGGATALMIACVVGGPSIVDALLRAGADPNASDSCGWTALHLCGTEHHPAVIRSLVGASAVIDSQTTAGLTPLMAVVIGGDYAPAQTMLELGANTESAINELRLSLTDAGPFVAELCGTAIMRRLRDCKDGAGNKFSLEGHTALGVAAALGRTRMLEVLIEGGGNPNSPTGNDRTMPLHAAIACGHIDAAKTLLLRGSDVKAWLDERSAVRGTVRDCPSCQKEIIATAKRCPHCGAVAYGADSSPVFEEDLHPLNLAIDEDGTTLIMHAVAIGDAELLDACINTDPPLNQPNRRLSTALMMAADVGSAATAAALIRAGAGVDYLDDEKQTALMRAITAGATDVALLLIEESDCVLTHTDDKGWGALHLAVSTGNTKVLSSLLDSGTLTRDTKVAIEGEAGLITFSKGDQRLEIAPEESAETVHELLRSHSGRHGSVEWFRAAASVEDELDRVAAEVGLDCALARSVWQEQVHLVRAALARGANPNWGDPRAHDKTALFYAVVSPNPVFTELLLEAGARTDATETQTGATPLHFFAGSIKPDGDRLAKLLAAGSDVTATDNNDLRPIDYAERSGHTQVQQALLRAGSPAATYNERVAREERLQSVRDVLSLIGYAAAGYFAASAVRDWWQKEDEE